MTEPRIEISKESLEATLRSGRWADDPITDSDSDSELKDTEVCKCERCFYELQQEKRLLEKRVNKLDQEVENQETQIQELDIEVERLLAIISKTQHRF